METFFEDLRYAVRVLRKSPGFTLVAVLTLALGIGANTAIFSVVNGVLLNPLPFPRSNELVTFYENHHGFKQASISYPNFLDWQQNNRTFAAMAAYRSDDYSLTGMGEAERVKVEMVSADFFPILGVTPALGRTFTPDEDRLGTAPVAVISAGLWKRKFGSDQGIVGKQVTMDGRGYTIIGVLPASFHLLVQNFDADTEVFVPVGQYADPLFRERRAGEGLDGIGRLKPGVTLAQARSDMDRVTRDLSAMYPVDDQGVLSTVVPLKEEMVGQIEPFLLVLLAGVGFVLLIACVNVANLLLARASGRFREFAIRAALGASQSRVVRQLLTESVLLAGAGGALGLVLAQWGTQAAIALLPQRLPRAEQVVLDGRVLMFTFLVSMLAGILFGLVPALRTLHPNLQETLRESSRGSSGTRHRAQSVFIVAEMAMAVVLLAGAGLMIRTLVRLWNVNPGFNPKNAMTFLISLPPSLGPSPTATRAALRQLHDTVQAVPGVKSVSVTLGALPMNGDSELGFWLDTEPKPATLNDAHETLIYAVDPDYLSAMGVPLERGRFLTAQDNENAPVVGVIDESLARKYFPGKDPVGQTIHVGLLDVSVRIVGVAGHVLHWGLGNDELVRAQLYISLVQIPDKFWQGTPSGEVVVRGDRPPMALMTTIRHEIEKLSPENVVYDPRTLGEQLANSMAARRFAMILLGVFGGLAVLLSSIGIYGVISYVVGQRTHEIGVRMALGAQRAHVLEMILKQGLGMTAIGVAIGLAAAVALTRMMSQLIYGISATDPITFAGVVIVMLFVALAACYIPARRAMHVDPVIALRYE
jgi:predicted permease